VLNRHLTTCGQAVTGARVDRRSVNRACNSCRERKIKCNSTLPCDRCTIARVQCSYSLRRERRDSMAVPRPSLPVPDLEHSPFSHQPSSQDDTSQSTVERMSRSPANGGDIVMPAPEPHSNTVDALGPIVQASELNQQHQQHQPSQPQALHLAYGLPSALEESHIDVETLWDVTDASFDMFQAFDWTNLVRNSSAQPSTMFAMEVPAGEIQTTTESVVPAIEAPSAESDSFLYPMLVASGLGLAQLDPLEHHRSRIIAYLEVNGSDTTHALTFFRTQTLGQIINTYFLRHHRHTPIIHLPTWSITSCSTSLVLAMSLITASYMPGLCLRSRHMRSLLHVAYSFVITNDEVSTISLLTVITITYHAIENGPRCKRCTRNPAGSAAVGHFRTNDDLKTGQFRSCHRLGRSDPAGTTGWAL
jgi:hypothetical protein